MRKLPQRPFAGMEITTDTLRPLHDAAVANSRIVASPPLQISERPGGGLVISLGRLKNPLLHVRWFRITGSSQVGTNKQWMYTATRLSKATAGYGGWTDHTTDTAAYTLYNMMEDQNGATGTYGNGATQTDIDAVGGTFAVVPVPTGTRVPAHRVTLDGASAEWWFAAPNGVTGACA